MRKLIAAALAGFVLVFSVVMPARAFWPVAVIAAPQMVSVSGASYAIGALGGVVGLVGMYLEIEDATSGDKVRIPVKDGAAAEPPAPAAAATVTPTSAPGVWTCVANGFETGTGSTAQEACGQPRGATQYACPNWNQATGACYKPVTGAYYDAGQGRWYVNYTYDVYCISSNCVNGATYGQVVYADSAASQMASNVSQGSATQTCAAGYSLQNGICQLSNGRIAAPDKKCDLKFTGTGAGSRYMYYDDADCPNGPTVDNSKFVPGLRMEGKVVWMAGTDAYGQKVVWQVLVDDSGGQVVLEKWRQVETGGNSAVEKTSYNIDRTTGTVTTAGQVTAAGTISAPSASTVPTTTTTAPTAADTPTVQMDATKPLMQFPNDYARENTTQAIQGDTTAIKDALSNTLEAPADPTVPGQSDFDSKWFGTTFNSLQAWSLPAHSSVCPTSSFDWNGKAYTFNAHCVLVQDHFNALEAAMMVAWSVLALFIVMKA